MGKGINILDHKYTNLKAWLLEIESKKGLDSTLTIGQIYEMLLFLDKMEHKIDEVILAALSK